MIMTFQVIRESKQGQNKVIKETPGLLDGNNKKHFWADAAKGLVRFGVGNAVGTNIIMSWRDPTPFVVEHVGFSSGQARQGNPGKWGLR